MSSKRTLVIVIFGLLLSFAVARSAAASGFPAFQVSSTWLPSSCGAACSNPDSYPLDPTSIITIDPSSGLVIPPSTNVTIQGRSMSFVGQTSGTGFTLLTFSQGFTNSQFGSVGITLQLYVPGSLVGYTGGTLCSATNACAGVTSNEVVQCTPNGFTGTGCTGINSGTFNLNVGQLTVAVPNPVPFVNQPLVPTAAAPGGSAFTLTVNGTGFVSSATVRWNGAALPTTFVNSSQVTAAVPASKIAAAGTAEISVLNPIFPFLGGGLSNVVLFPVTSQTSRVAFQAGTVVNGSAGLGNTLQLAAGDFTGTGKLDLISPSFTATSATNGTIPYWRGNGDGTFQAPVPIQVQVPVPSFLFLPGNTFDVAVGDFNRDGKLDAVVVGTILGTGGPTNTTAPEAYVAFLAGNGDGTFQPFVGSLFGSSSPQQLTQFGPGIAVGDINGDGNLDLVVACTQSSSSPTINESGICALLGDGQGGFSAPPFLFSRFYPSPFQVNSLVLGDFNRDGKLDIIATGGNLPADQNPSNVIFLAGNGDGTFAPDQLIYKTPGTHDGIGSLATADLDHDGLLDLVFTHGCAAASCSWGVDFLHGNGDGIFQPPLTADHFPSFSPPIFGDFNADGNLDLSVLNIVFLVDDRGLPIFPILQFPNRRIPVVVGDFNGDGKLDLMATLVGSQNELQPLLQVAPPADFEVAVSSDFQTVTAGGTAAFTVTITGVNGFNGVVTPSLTGLPAGTTVSYNPATVTGSGTIVVTITTSATTPKGTYPLAGSLTSGSIVHSGPVFLTVQ